MIDYVLVNHRFRSSVLDTRVYRSTYLQSDHELVVSSLRFKIKAKCHKPMRNTRPQTQSLSSDVVSSYKSVLLEAFDRVPQEMSDVENTWILLKDSLQEACECLPEKPARVEADWMTDEVRNLSRKKRDAWLNLNGSGSHGNKELLLGAYKKLKKQIEVAADKARNAWWSARAEEAEKRAMLAEQLGRGGSLIKELRLLGKQVSKASVTPLMGRDGSTLIGDEEKLQRWAEHFSSVVNCESVVSEVVLEALPVVEVPQLGDSDMSFDDDELCLPLSEEEISVAVSQLKNGRAPGQDSISAEMLKLGGGISIRWLKYLFDLIWSTESIPSDWRRQTIIPLHKKGSRSTCDNYRGIALLSTPSKVFSKAILNRLKPRVETLLRENQCGFRRGRGCADQLFSLRVLMERAREFRRPLYACFIDLRKAYDSVNRNALWSVLKRCYHLPTKLISIIQALHENSTAAVRAYGKTSQEFAVTTGVRQGCVLAPTLFNLFFDIVIRKALDIHQQEGRGIRMLYLLDGNLVGNRRKMTMETLVTDLEYADDMALLCNSWDDMTVMLRGLEGCFRDVGLTISCSKTKIMAVLPDGTSQPPEPISLRPGEVPVEVVSNFQYLGSVVSSDCSPTAEVESRIAKASQAFRSLSRLLWYQKRIKTTTKLRIFNSVIVPTLLYGLESVVLLEPHIHRLQSFIMRCLRIILRVSIWDKKRNTSIRKMAQQQRVSSIVSQRRLRLLGHIVRMDDHRLPKQLLVSAPYGGSRAVGGQKSRWNDLVQRDLRQCGLEDSWRVAAQNRNGWRSVVKSRIEDCNRLAKEEEKRSKDEQKRRREDRQMTSNTALSCDHSECDFVALSEAGMTNHKRQKHIQPRLGQCPHCN